MLTYTAATSYVADIFLRRVRVRFRVTVYTQLAVGVYWDSTPLTASAEIFKVYISFTLFTCDCTLIYTLMYCVCQHTDPGMVQKHRGLSRLESGRYRNGIRAHVSLAGSRRPRSSSSCTCAERGGAVRSVLDRNGSCDDGDLNHEAVPLHQPRFLMLPA